MYLEHYEYVLMGGTLDDTAFPVLERRARQLINSQAGGQTGERIGRLSEIPQAVKECVFDLVAVLAAHSPENKQISGESQSQGGKSESYSYAVKTDDEVHAECENIINNALYGGGLGYLLYRGAGI